jgi:hypothetical protein
MMIRLTPYKINILNKLFVKKIETGTLKDIAKQVDGINWKSETYSFLQDCVHMGILEVRGDIEEENDKSKRYSVYSINRRKLVSFWTSRAEHKFSCNLMVTREKKAAILRRLFNEKIPKGRLEEIASFLEGREASPVIVNILEEFKEYDVFEVDYDEMNKQGTEDKLYKVNGENLIEHWKKYFAEEYQLSEDIVREEHSIVF